MKKQLSAIVAFSLIIIHPVISYGGFSDFFKKIRGTLTTDTTDLSENSMIKGIREALTVGTVNAVNSVSAEDGFLKSPDIRIPLPGLLKKSETILKAAGFGPKLEEFERSINRAAEYAAPESKKILLDAVRDMNLADAGKILNGRNNEATLYFREKTFDRLVEIFKPLVHSSMAKTGVTQKYQEIESKLKALPLAGIFNINTDLEHYVSESALDGIFKRIETEEAKIREDPAARVSGILREVFGNRQQ